MAKEPCVLYTLDEAAELLHLSRRTLHGHILSGALPGRLRATIGTAPAWVGDRILQASKRIPDPRAALFGEN